MRLKHIIFPVIAAVALLTGCETISPNAALIGRGNSAPGQWMFDRANQLWNGNQYTPPDRREAIRCLIVSGQQGNTNAMMILGDFCEHGRPPLVYPKASEAFDWYHRAALAGDTRGMAKVAGFYGDGIGVQRNPPECFRWVKQLSQANDPMATVLLGEFYERGYGVTADKEQAKACYELAAKSGNAKAVAKANEHLNPAVVQNNQQLNEQIQVAAFLLMGALASDSLMGGGGGNYDTGSGDNQRQYDSLRAQRESEAEERQRAIEKEQVNRANQELYKPSPLWNQGY